MAFAPRSLSTQICSLIFFFFKYRWDVLLVPEEKLPVVDDPCDLSVVAMVCFITSDFQHCSCTCDFRPFPSTGTEQWVGNFLALGYGLFYEGAENRLLQQQSCIKNGRCLNSK